MDSNEPKNKKGKSSIRVSEEVREQMKALKLKNTAAPIGSVIVCPNCGKSFIKVQLKHQFDNNLCQIHYWQKVRNYRSNPRNKSEHKREVNGKEIDVNFLKTVIKATNESSNINELISKIPGMTQKLYNSIRLRFWHHGVKMKELKGREIADLQSRRLSKNEWEELRRFAEENNPQLKEGNVDTPGFPFKLIVNGDE